MAHLFLQIHNQSPFTGVLGVEEVYHVDVCHEFAECYKLLGDGALYQKHY